MGKIVKEKYRILEYDNRFFKNRIYLTCNDIGKAIKICRGLNSKQQGIIPEYTYTVSCGNPC